MQLMYSCTLLTLTLASGWLVNATSWPFYHGERDPVLIVHEAGWVAEPTWTVAENLAPTGFDPFRDVYGY